MKEVNCPLDFTTFNVMIDVYGQLDMVKEADRLFWSMRKMDIEPNVVSYNTILRVYGEAELFGEAIHLFRLMQRKDIEQNVVTYNTMIKIYGTTMEHEKATNLVQEMQSRGIELNAITYSTIISIWGKSGKLDQAATLFQKLRSSGVEIDQVLYQTMIVAYERVGLMGHAKRLLQELKRPNNIPRETAITILAKAGRIEEATWVFRQAFDSGEVKDIFVFGCMINLYLRNQRYVNVTEVFEKMRSAGYFPDSNIIAIVLNYYGKQREFERRIRFTERCKRKDVFFLMSYLVSVIPSSIGKLDKIEELLLHRSGFHGEIPTSYLDLTSLKVLDLCLNNLAGEITRSLSGKRLISLSLRSNLFEGSLPNSIGECFNVEKFQVHDNGLSGELPLGLWSSPKSKIIRAGNNRFTSQVTEYISLASSLEQVEIDNNSFSGAIPHDLGVIKNLYKFSASENGFEGGLPQNFCVSPVLSIVNISYISLPGKITKLKNCMKLCLFVSWRECIYRWNQYFFYSVSLSYCVSVKTKTS
ncbi:unnamed protein product [Eruca vesicaria subsp. sativa]|uniref:Pentatricopeptide repeat-containing protein n=1 Tax=Eruca vesicaria subsp. sativa TaxID=29727 RepID=A0ABC8JSD5_ERUVS|nr:unnamed protein product [Eruca vesicaria subsp. sativa]